MVFRSYKRRRYSRYGRYGRYKRKFSRFTKYRRGGYKRRYATLLGRRLAKKSRTFSVKRTRGIKGRKGVYLPTIPYNNSTSSSDGPWWMGNGVRSALAAGIAGGVGAYKTYKKWGGYYSKGKKILNFLSNSYKAIRNRYGGKYYFNNKELEGMDRNYLRNYYGRKSLQRHGALDITRDGFNDMAAPDIDVDSPDSRYYRAMKQEKLRQMSRKETGLFNLGQVEWAPKKVRGDPWPELKATDHGLAWQLSASYRELLQKRWDAVLAGRTQINDLPEATIRGMQQYRYEILKEGIDIAAPDLHDRPKLNLNALKEDL